LYLPMPKSRYLPFLWGSRPRATITKGLHEGGGEVSLSGGLTYSSGWIINRTGTYVMRVYYAPQAQANEIIGMQLSAIAISVALVGYGFPTRKRLTKGLPNSQVKGKFGYGAPSGFGEGGDQYHLREVDQMMPKVR